MITMLLIGDDIPEKELFQLLTKGNTSLHDVNKKMKYDYISQIQDEETYRYFNKNFENPTSIQILKLIKDMGINYNILKNRYFIKKYSNEIFFKLLLTNSSSTYAFQQGYKHIEASNALIYHMSPPEKLSVYDELNVIHDFNFSNRVDIEIPFHVLIGKNGSGKTHLLWRIVKNQLTASDNLHTERGVFSRVIVLSNTINDECYRPSRITRDKSKRNNYHFISLTSKKHFNNIFQRGGKLTLLSLIEKIAARDSRREGKFKQSELLDRITKKIIPEFSFEIKTNLDKINFSSFTEFVERYGLINLNANLNLISNSEVEYIQPGDDIKFYNNGADFTLSSGQYSFLVCMFSIISTIETNSLILIEEPENYLHPSLLTHFINSMTHILRDTNSVSLISTHSALVLRETPSEQVTILLRNNNKTKFKKPNIETFGSDTHQIMIDVFGDLFSNAIFREELSRIAKNKNIEEILRDYSHLPSDLINRIVMEVKIK